MPQTPPPPFLLIGLTGGIASGKSTVATYLAELGAHIIDADALYHALISPQAGSPSPLAQRIATDFGAEALQPDGSLNRAAIAQRVFSDVEARKHLEAITHPAIAKSAQNAILALQQQGAQWAIYDMPLLFEATQNPDFIASIVVWLPEFIQRNRLITRHDMSAEEAQARIHAQLPLDEKRHRATWVIDNSGTPEETQAHVQELWPKITRCLQKHQGLATS